MVIAAALLSCRRSGLRQTHLIELETNSPGVGPVEITIACTPVGLQPPMAVRSMLNSCHLLVTAIGSLPGIWPKLTQKSWTRSPRSSPLTQKCNTGLLVDQIGHIHHNFWESIPRSSHVHPTFACYNALGINIHQNKLRIRK